MGAGAEPAPAPAIRLEGITKSYGAVVACNAVGLSLHRGRIHGVLGENGAGKSTLMKVLGGIHQPDEGTIYVGEKPAVMNSPIEAKEKGIIFIHQELSLARSTWARSPR